MRGKRSEETHHPTAHGGHPCAEGAGLGAVEGENKVRFQSHVQDNANWGPCYGRSGDASRIKTSAPRLLAPAAGFRINTRSPRL